MHLCQLAQYADTLMQLGGNAHVSSKTRYSTSGKRDNVRDQRDDQGRACNRGKRTSIHAFVAQVEEQPKNNAKAIILNSQVKNSKVTPSNASQVGYCRVCLDHDHTMKRCLFAVIFDK